MKKNIKQLKSDYEELQIKPSADLWDQLDSALEKGSELSVKSSSSFGWLKYAAIVLLLISFGTVIYFTGDSNTEKTDHLVKKNLEKELIKIENPAQIMVHEENLIEKTAPKMITETATKNKPIIKKDFKPQKELIKSQISEQTQPIIVINQPENQSEHPEIIEKSNPVISETKKISYVSANDLLLGRELDRSRENANVEKKKFGVIHLDKVLPNFHNVTVLGVSVYVDPR
ncbi:hypothetical protein PGH12_04000 [Chryseobacterium wangxinyae]|uniref:hypothetical protein n=1 Tax=Chryseobacterium sp. CY350 TaxID=2997336 RepID=UPI002270078E|nr:hypothetical protein [Chryseobacterium sp. CY350]MCY0978544.1 hypothetical protein [Chryseobacterium sp. CY350]WBZ96315.1 hypothetical protein PGH12_04000 [Chryseobacterium sp. CY350]